MIFGFELVTPLQVDPAFVSIKIESLWVSKGFCYVFRYDLYYINIYGYSIYLTRGGLVSMPTGSLRDAGSNGYYWAIPTYPSELSAYYLVINSAIVYPSYLSNRWYGFTVPTNNRFQVSTKRPRAGPQKG